MAFLPRPGPAPCRIWIKSLNTYVAMSISTKFHQNLSRDSVLKTDYVSRIYIYDLYIHLNPICTNYTSPIFYLLNTFIK